MVLEWFQRELTNSNNIVRNSALTFALGPTNRTLPRAPCNHSSARYASFAFRFQVSNRSVDNLCLSLHRCLCCVFVCLSASVSVLRLSLPLFVHLSLSPSVSVCVFCLSRFVFVFLGPTRSDSVCHPRVSVTMSLMVSACLCLRACPVCMFLRPCACLSACLPFCWLAWLSSRPISCLPACHGIGPRSVRPTRGTHPSAQQQI